MLVSHGTCDDRDLQNQELINVSLAVPRVSDESSAGVDKGFCRESTN